MGVSAPPRARTAWASHGMCRRASVGQPRASRKEATATTGPTLQRDPGSHHATIVAAASTVTVRIPMIVGTCRVARVSRRRPRPWPVRRRVGGVDVITLPWSHMCAPHEAGQLSRVVSPRHGHGVGPASRRHGLGDEARCGTRPVWVDARRHGMRAGVDWSYSCGARRTGMPRAPNSAATSGLRADRRIRFGVLCRTCAPTVARETSGGRRCNAAPAPTSVTVNRHRSG